MKKLKNKGLEKKMKIEGVSELGAAREASSFVKFKSHFLIIKQDFRLRTTASTPRPTFLER